MLAYTLETERLSDTTTVVRVAGELDMYTAPSFEQALTPVLADGTQRVVVDLSKCEFLDCSALGILVAARASLDGKTELVLVATDPNILRVFQITGFDRVFTIKRAIPTTRRRALDPGSSANGARPRAVLRRGQ